MASKQILYDGPIVIGVTFEPILDPFVVCVLRAHSNLWLARLSKNGDCTLSESGGVCGGVLQMSYMMADRPTCV